MEVQSVPKIKIESKLFYVNLRNQVFGILNILTATYNKISCMLTFQVSITKNILLQNIFLNMDFDLTGPTVFIFSYKISRHTGVNIPKW